MLPGLGGDRHVIKKTSKGEQLKARECERLSNENKLQSKGGDRGMEKAKKNEWNEMFL